MKTPKNRFRFADSGLCLSCPGILPSCETSENHQPTWRTLRHGSTNAGSGGHSNTGPVNVEHPVTSASHPKRGIKNTSIDKYRPENCSSTTVTKTSNLQKGPPPWPSQTHTRAYFSLPTNQNLVQVGSSPNGKGCSWHKCVFVIAIGYGSSAGNIGDSIILCDKHRRVTVLLRTHRRTNTMRMEQGPLHWDF